MIVKKKHEIHKKNEEEIRKRWHFEEAVCFEFFFLLLLSLSSSSL